MTDLIVEFNKERKANKEQWVFFHGEINGVPVAIKSFNTWIQIAKYNGNEDGGPMGCSVKAMNEWLTKFLNRGERC